MNFSSYLKDKYLNIICFLIEVLFIYFTLLLFEINMAIIIIIELTILLCNIPIFILEFYRKQKFYNGFISKLDSLNKKYLITEMSFIPPYDEEKIFLDSLSEIDKSMHEYLNIYKHEIDEFKEYLELWCHEIKTPIATIDLIIENNNNNSLCSIRDEVNKIDGYVEQVLFFARSENVYEDYIIKKLNIKDIVNEVIKKNKKILIEKNISIETFKNNIDIESDSKWLLFIINQILINSIKYSKDNNSIIKFDIIENNNNIVLSIYDNGIGISEDEISKVFNKGFTGSNGRKKYNSTGIGLYLVKKLCKKLNHEIKIESIENEFTKVSIIFPKSSMYKE